MNSSQVCLLCISYQSMRSNTMIILIISLAVTPLREIPPLALNKIINNYCNMPCCYQNYAVYHHLPPVTINFNAWIIR